MIREYLAVTIQQVGLLDADPIFLLNEEIFHESRLINHFDHTDLIFLLAYYRGIPVGFKVGYALDKQRYYSAKGGVLQKFRRNGVASILLFRMMEIAVNRGYKQFLYDTYPEKDLGMYLLGKKYGFEEIEKEWNSKMKGIRVRLGKMI